MTLSIREVAGRRELRTFIELPERIHAGHEGWVHPIYMDEWPYFDPKKNKAFTYCTTTRLLAWRDGRPVGRILGIINDRYNELCAERTARFGFLETWEEPDVVDALLGAVEEWARSHRMDWIVGPYGFSDQDPEGLMIQNEAGRATIVTYFNFSWMPGMVERNGFEKDIDYVVYKIDIPDEIPPFYQKIHDRVMKRGHLELQEFSSRREIKPWVRLVLALMNECYSDGEIYGYVPLDEAEMDDLARRYLPILDPRFVKVVTHEGEVVSFIIGIPDISEGLRRARGRMLPFGVFKILRAARKARQLDLLLGAVKKPYRGRGLDVMMGVATIRSAREAGFDFIDTHHEMETNTAVRGEMERMGGRVYKRYRVYRKAL